MPGRGRPDRGPVLRYRRYGADAVLVELGSASHVDAVRAALADAVADGRLPEPVELVPAARTVLIAFRPGTDGPSRVRAVLAAADLTAGGDRTPRVVDIAVHYDGDDLELVAETAGLAVAEVVRLHSETEYTVAFTGFAPGFGYLVGLPEPLRQPRLEQPRTRVPAGAVGIADEYTGVYPRPSPGGWRLLGHTEADLFDPRRDPPALLAPGDRVRFEVLS
jgi:KipI family sensor histidine kinase inhibitor